MLSAQVIDRVRRHRLSNGLTVLTSEDPATPLVTSMIWYRVGTRCEAPGSTGVSHLLEHMTFKGSARFSKGEIDAVTTRNGGANNALTSNDFTAYYFTFASDRWWPALEIEADRMHNSLFDPAEFELERRVVIEELKTELDDPWGALRLAVEGRSFRRHPYRFPVLGLYEDLRNLTPAQLMQHYRRYYCPANATLVLAGRFSTAAALDRIERLFGDFPAGEPCRLELPADPPRRRSQRLQLKSPSRLARMLVAFRAPSVRDPDHYALHIADKLLGEGRLCRLYRRLVEEEGVASSLSCDFADTYDPYLFTISAELQRGRDPLEAERLLFQELRRLAQEPPGEEEMLRARIQCLFAFLSSFETSLDQAFQLGLMETLLRYEYWANYSKRIEELTADEVSNFAGRCLARGRATIGILQP